MLSSSERLNISFIKGDFGILSLISRKLVGMVKYCKRVVRMENRMYERKALALSVKHKKLFVGGED